MLIRQKENAMADQKSSRICSTERPPSVSAGPHKGKIMIPDQGGESGLPENDPEKG